jgi:hypothetical protein
VASAFNIEARKTLGFESSLSPSGLRLNGSLENQKNLDSLLEAFARASWIRQAALDAPPLNGWSAMWVNLNPLDIHLSFR